MWQYKVVILKAGMIKWKWDDDSLDGLSVEEGLNKLGRQGWELVTTPDYLMAGSTSEIMFIFKKGG